MNAASGLIPLGVEESDLVMLLFSLFLLALLVIAMFMFLPLFYAILGTLVIVFGIFYGVWALRQKEDQID
ncbi:MAG: hypothetical protein E4H14_19975 [Candidatus Thorarchaeota archaeon]|nr:MAG: hypothetical protein E4H14_19975 [Candidatus Thorarchaeota archaeon]